MNQLHRLLYLIAATMVIASSLYARQGSSETKWPQGFYIKTAYAVISNPGFLDPLGGEDGPVVPQSRTTAGVGLGYEYFFAEGFGVFGGVLYVLSKRFNSFGYTSEVGTSVTYQDPEFGLVGFEFSGHWFPKDDFPLSLYVVFDIAVVSESYKFTDSSFPKDNGPQEHISARPGIGLGTRIVLWRSLSLQLEYQWIVAASSTTSDLGEYVYTDSQGYDWYRIKSSDESTFYTKLLTAGIVFTF